MTSNDSNDFIQLNEEDYDIDALMRDEPENTPIEGHHHLSQGTVIFFVQNKSYI